LIGGTSLDNRGCWQFAWWTKWTPYVAQAGYDIIKSMLEDNAPEDAMDFDTYSKGLSEGFRRI